MSTEANAQAEFERLRQRAIQLLQQERRSMHTWELAMRLSATTHLMHSAMHIALMERQVSFLAAEGWDLVPQFTPAIPIDDGQQPLA